MGGEDHRCEWRDKAESLEAQLAAAVTRLGEATDTITALGARVASLQSTVEKLQRQVYGPRSEKMPRVSDEIRDASTAEADREAALQKRRDNAAKKRELPTRCIEHKIPEDRKVCPEVRGPRLHATRRGQAHRGVRARACSHRAPAACSREGPLPVRRDDHHRRSPG